MRAADGEKRRTDIVDEKLHETLKGIWDSLTEEQKEKGKALKTMDELMKLAGQEGIELPDEALDAVSGGCNDSVAPYVGDSIFL